MSTEKGKDLALIQCVSCDERGARLYEPGGWWDLPRRWLQHIQADGSAIYACGQECARRYEKHRRGEE